ncbi:MAG: LptF/LptG family permease [Lentisphaeria bacterium]|nr:LptF/LptG family permease [Lentisphaeria bacterium]
MPTLDGYILRSFLVPFFILLFAFTLLFIIMDMYNDVGDFLDNKASVSVSVEYFILKIPGNIRFILPITVLLACMYALANLGRSRELTAIRASGISLSRCGMPIFAVGFCVMLVNFYFNERLVPETTRQAEILRKVVNNENYVEESNARLQFHSGDNLRSWYFGQFDDDDFQKIVKLKIFKTNPEKPRQRILIRTIEAEKTRFVPGTGWEFYKPEIHEYSEDGLPGETMVPDTDPMVLSEEEIPDKPSVIVKSVIEPEALSSVEIFMILWDNPSMAENLRRIYRTIFYNRLAFPWACFLCAFFAFPLATKNERSGIFTAIATAVGIAVLYQVLNEIFMVAGKSGYLPPVLAGLTPTIIFGAYGIYLLKKAG